MPVGAMSTALKLVGKFPTAPKLLHDGGNGGGGMGSLEEALAARELTVAVDWCTINLPRPEGGRSLRPSHGAYAYAQAHPELYTCTMGSLIKRKAVDLAQYDVYRTMWEDEGGRWSCQEELAAGQ